MAQTDHYWMHIVIGEIISLIYFCKKRLSDKLELTVTGRLNWKKQSRKPQSIGKLNENIPVDDENSSGCASPLQRQS